SINGSNIVCNITYKPYTQAQINNMSPEDLNTIINSVAGKSNAADIMKQLFGNNAVTVNGANTNLNINKDGVPYNYAITNGTPVLYKGNQTGLNTTANPPQITLSAQNTQELQTALAAAGNNTATKRNIVAQYLLEHFGNNGATATGAISHNSKFSDTSYSYAGSSTDIKMTNGIVGTDGSISIDNYKDMMDVIVSFSGKSFSTGGEWGAINNRYPSRVNSRVESFYRIVDKMLTQINSSTAQTDASGVQSRNAVTFNISDISIFTDPIGFDSNGVRYDFVEDENNDGKFNEFSEFVGAGNSGWADLTKYDTNNDGKIDGDELKKLKVLSQNEQTGEHEIISADKIGISQIDLSSYQITDEIDENGNILAGTFKLKINNVEITGKQTYDSDEYLNEYYNDEKGLSYNA
ncbi:MAG: hypothetical protein PHC34_11305, partial [Candidatus Gastranaerophilales bacterium]|nr:hypothetical protein [Candidatus Gastranaerophilales bacterium]